MRDLVNKTTATYFGAPTNTINQSGRALVLNSASSQYVQFPYSNNYELIGAMTLVFSGVILSNSTYNFLLATASSDGSVNDPFELRINPSGVISVVRANGSTFDAFVSGATVPLNVPVNIVISCGPSLNAVPTGFVNGINVSITATSATLTSPVTANTNPLTIGTRGDLYNYANIQGALFAGLPYAASLGATRSLSLNPWQLFAPANDGLWLPSSALFPTLSSPRMTGITSTGGVPTVNYTF